MRLTRRSFVAGSAAGVAAAALPWRARAADTRPNLILLIADDMRFDAAGCLGNSIIKTPHLDRLAKEGAVCADHFVTTSICPISRASIVSGQYALRHGVREFNDTMREASQKQCFHLLLRDAGYYTGFVGKWGFGNASPREQFSVWKGFSGQGQYFNERSLNHMTDKQTIMAQDFLGDRPADAPFLLIISYKAPHEPLVPQVRFRNLYTNVKFPRDVTDTLDASDRLPPLLKGSSPRTKYNSGMADEAQYQARQRGYYQLITGVDDSVGQLLKVLETQHALDNTHIIFTADNGEMKGAHRLDGKWCMYESSIRVPLIARLAGGAKGVRPAGMTLNIDLAPTLLEAGGVKPPASMQGRSLLPLLQGKPAENGRGGFYYEHPAMPRFDIVGCEGWRGQEWKYTRYSKGEEVNDCLFNLKEDPNELANLAQEKPEKLEELKAKVEAEKKQLA